MAPITHQISHGPSFAMLRCELVAGQVLIAQAGAMVARSTHVDMEVKLNAGAHAGLWALIKALFVACLRKLIGGETFFVNHFSTRETTRETTRDRGSVWVAPTLSGEIVHQRLQGSSITLSAGAFLACAGDIELRLKWGGLRALLAKNGLFLLELSGTGDLWFNSYGGVQTLDIDGSYVVDNGHLVGFSGALSYRIASVGGGVMGFVASGEGLVCEFEGRGRVYIQSRNLDALSSWVAPLLP